MEHTDRNLLYVTLGFPSDLYSEKSFVEGELEALRSKFDRIVLVPTVDFGRKMNYAGSLPEGVTVDWGLAENVVFQSKLLRLPYIFHPEVIRSLWQIRKEARTPAQWIKGFFQSVNIVHVRKIIRTITGRHGFSRNDTVLMSMWFHDPASALASLGLKEGWHVATHAHTSDLYDNRMLFRSRIIRDQLLGGIDYVFAISARGRDYMQARYPRHADKIIHHPLGSRRLFLPVGAPDSDALTFATVARVQEEKCHDLILDTLHQLAQLLPEVKIRWTVIGDGPDLGKLKSLTAKIQTPNFEVIFTGALGNIEIQRRLSEHPPHWFILMSRTEGLPVSVGEAMSYGIPIIITDVGDVRELVTPECAILLPAPYQDGSTGSQRRGADLYARELATLVIDNDLRARMGAAAVARWEDFFNAGRTSRRLAGRLASLLKPC